MALIDNKGKLFGKVNIIDLSIILVVVLVAAAVYGVYFRKTESAEATADRIEYDVELTVKPEEFVDAIKIGDEIRDSVRGHYLGKVIDKKKLPATKVIENIDKGEFVKAEIPGMYDVIVTIEANGMVTPRSILAEGVEVKVGQRMYIKGKGYASPGYIVRLVHE